MKTTLPTFLLFLFLQTGFSQDLTFNVRGTNALPVTKEQLHKAQTMVDINPGYPSSWITEYISSEILAVKNGRVVKAVGINNIFNDEQKSILNSFDPGTDVLVEVKHRVLNSVTGQKEVNSMNFLVTVAPETKAEFEGGQKKMEKYLKENAINKIPEACPKDMFAVVKFTVNEDGAITNAQMSTTSGDKEIDTLLLEAINKMPKWKPAQDANGIKVRQQFTFSVGNGGC